MSTFDHAIRVAPAAPRFRPAAIGGRVGTVFGNLFPTTPALVDAEAPVGGNRGRGGRHRSGAGRIGPTTSLSGRSGRPSARPMSNPNRARRSGGIRPRHVHRRADPARGAGLPGRDAPRPARRRPRPGRRRMPRWPTAITDLVDAGVGLINLSFTGDGTETEAPSSIVEALYGAKEKGVLIVAAVSNDPTAPHQLPGPGGRSRRRPPRPGRHRPAGDRRRRDHVPQGRSRRPGGEVVPEPPTALFGWQPPPGNDWLHCRANGVACWDRTHRTAGCGGAAARSPPRSSPASSPPKRASLTRRI